MLAFKLASAKQQTPGVSCQVSHMPPPASLCVAGDASTSARFGHAKRAPLNLGVRPVQTRLVAMHMPPMRTLPLRLGAGSLGLLLGLPLGLVFALLATALSQAEHLSMATWVFSTGGALFAACFLFPDSALQAFPWLVHFLLGAIPNSQNWKKHAGLLPNEQTPPRFHCAFRIGIVAAVILAGIFSYMAVNPT